MTGHTLLSGLLAAAVIAVSSGCGAPGSYDHTDLDVVGSDGTGTPLSSVSVTVGDAVEIAAVPMSATGQLGGGFTFDLASSNPGVLEIQPALGQTSGQADFVFIGVSPGQVEILVTIDDTPRPPIPAEVVAQQTP